MQAAEADDYYLGIVGFQTALPREASWRTKVNEMPPMAWRACAGRGSDVGSARIAWEDRGRRILGATYLQIPGYNKEISEGGKKKKGN